MSEYPRHLCNAGLSMLTLLCQGTHSTSAMSGCPVELHTKPWEAPPLVHTWGSPSQASPTAIPPATGALTHSQSPLFCSPISHGQWGTRGRQGGVSRSPQGLGFSPEASWPSCRADWSGRETKSPHTTSVVRQKLHGMVASYEKSSGEKISLLQNAPPDHPAETILTLTSTAIPQLFSSTFDFLISF